MLFVLAGEHAAVLQLRLVVGVVEHFLVGLGDGGVNGEGFGLDVVLFFGGEDFPYFLVFLG